MTNRILNKNIVSNNAEDNDQGGETYFSKAQNHSDLGGQFTTEKPRLSGAGDKYPALPSTSPWGPQPDHGFHPDRDRIDPDENYSDRLGMDLSGKSNPSDPQVCPCPQATEGGEAPPAPAASPPSSLKRRI